MGQKKYRFEFGKGCTYENEDQYTTKHEPSCYIEKNGISTSFITFSLDYGGTEN
jgi:hypothetical protein